jgi:hypothetical protein
MGTRNLLRCRRGRGEAQLKVNCQKATKQLLRAFVLHTQFWPKSHHRSQSPRSRTRVSTDEMLSTPSLYRYPSERSTSYAQRPPVSI